MEAGEKLRLCIKHAGMKPAQFARHMGAKNPDQAVNNWMNRGIPKRLSIKAGRLLGRDPEWLSTDDDQLAEDAFSKGALDQAKRAEGMFELLTSEQADLVARLILEIARK